MTPHRPQHQGVLRHATLVLLCLAAWAAACSSTDESGACPGPEARVVPSDYASCQGLDEAACQAGCACEPLYGVNAATGGAREYVGCWTAFAADGAALSCTTAVYCAEAPGSGTVYQLPDCGPPDGWQRVSCP